jgi:hypothetical protein
VWAKGDVELMVLEAKAARNKFEKNRTHIRSGSRLLLAEKPYPS